MKRMQPHLSRSNQYNLCAGTRTPPLQGGCRFCRMPWTPWPDERRDYLRFAAHLCGVFALLAPALFLMRFHSLWWLLAVIPLGLLAVAVVVRFVESERCIAAWGDDR